MSYLVPLLHKFPDRTVRLIPDLVSSYFWRIETFRKAASLLFHLTERVFLGVSLHFSRPS